MPQQWDERKDAGLPGYYLVKKNGLWGIWSEDRGLVQPCRWFYIEEYRDGLTVVMEHRLGRMFWGLVDTAGHPVTPCRWEYETAPSEHGQLSNGRFVNGFAVVQESGHYGYIDRRGNVISPCIWDYTGSFDDSGHPALVFRRDGNYREAAGEWGGQMDWYYYYEEYPAYQIHPNTEDQFCPRGYFYLTRSGSVLTPQGVVQPGDLDPDRDLSHGWLKAEPFSEGTAFVQEDAFWSRIDQEGRPADWIEERDLRYPEQAFPANGIPCNGYTIVRDKPDAWGNCYRVLDRSNHPLSPYRWCHVEEQFEDDSLPIRVYRRQGRNAVREGIEDEGACFFRGNDPSYMLDENSGMAYHRGCYFLNSDGQVLTLSGAVTAQAEDELPDGWEWYEAILPFLYQPFYLNERPTKSFVGIAETVINGQAMALNTCGSFCISSHVQTNAAQWWDAVVPMEKQGFFNPLLLCLGNMRAILHGSAESPMLEFLTSISAFDDDINDPSENPSGGGRI